MAYPHRRDNGEICSRINTVDREVKLYDDKLNEFLCQVERDLLEELKSKKDTLTDQQIEQKIRMLKSHIRTTPNRTEFERGRIQLEVLLWYVCRR